MAYKAGFQYLEQRDSMDNITHAGVVSKKSPFANGDNTGIYDVIAENLRVLYDEFSTEGISKLKKDITRMYEDMCSNPNFGSTAATEQARLAFEYAEQAKEYVETIEQNKADYSKIEEYLLYIQSIIPKIQKITAELEPLVEQGSTMLPTLKDCATTAKDSAETAKRYADEARDIRNSLSTGITYCGSVNTMDDLPKSPSRGDMYNILSNDSNVIWDGSVWDNISGVMDISPLEDKINNHNHDDRYYIKDEIDISLGSKANIEHKHDNYIEKENVIHVRRGSNVHSAGGGGTGKYIQWAKLNITDSYANELVEFSVCRRGDKTPTRLSILFESTENNNPGLKSFIAESGTNEFYINHSSEGEWFLYAKKTENLDNLGVISFYIPEYMTSRICVTFVDSQCDELPTTAVQSKYDMGYSYGTADLEPGKSQLATGKLYFVYEEGE